MCGSGSVLGTRIRIHNAPEYGSNSDLDPQQFFRQFVDSSTKQKFSGAGAALKQDGSETLVFFIADNKQFPPISHI